MGNSLKSWVKRLRNGDQSAFLPFYEKTAPGLMRFLLWKSNGDKALAEDILQESYVRFLLHLDRLESEEEISIQSYLLRIVKHCLIDKVARSPHAARHHIPMEDALHLDETREEARQEQAVELRELAIAMSSLSEKDSEIIWLRDAMGMSHREVAEQIGITEQASRQAYVRAKRSLLSELAATGAAVLGGGDYVPELS
jgi:RNA polymerase sigma-70 factor, ECF subfamily